MKNSDSQLVQELYAKMRYQNLKPRVRVSYLREPYIYKAGNVRYIWASTGFLTKKEYIAGILHSVQPVCHENSKVFIQNTREYTLINTHSVGKVIQMEIGALLVGKISNHDLGWNNMVCAGQEKGYFEYGGSSIVLLTSLRAELVEELQYRKMYGNEIPVVIGEQLIK